MQVNGMDFAYACEQRLIEHWLQSKFQHSLIDTFGSSAKIIYDEMGFESLRKIVADKLYSYGITSEQAIINFMRKPLTDEQINNRFSSSIAVVVRWPLELE